MLKIETKEPPERFFEDFSQWQASVLQPAERVVRRPQDHALAPLGPRYDRACIDAAGAWSARARPHSRSGTGACRAARLSDWGARVIKVEGPHDDDMTGACDGSDFQNLHRKFCSVLEAGHLLTGFGPIDADHDDANAPGELGCRLGLPGAQSHELVDAARLRWAMTVTGWPALSRFLQIPLPIMPAPMHPMLCFISCASSGPRQGVARLPRDAIRRDHHHANSERLRHAQTSRERNAVSVAS